MKRLELHPTSRVGRRLWFIWHDRSAPKWQALLLGGLVGLVALILFAVATGGR